MSSRLAQAAVRAAQTPRAFALSRMCSLAALAALFAIQLGSPAQAINISASSSGYGLFVDVNALNVVNLDAGPLPVGVSGVAPAPYADSDTVLNVSISAGIPLVAEGDVTAGAVSASATSNVDGGFGSRITSASGGIVDGGVDMVTLPVLGPGITLLGIDATLNSTAQISGDFGSLAAVGTTTIQDLDLIISAIPVDLSAYVNVPVAPNTNVNLAVLGILNASLILNEQLIAGDQSSIVVNAFHLNVNVANSIVAQVILGHSQAQMTAAPIPEPSAAALAAIGLVGVLRAKLARSRRLRA